MDESADSLIKQWRLPGRKEIYGVGVGGGVDNCLLCSYIQPTIYKQQMT